MRRLVLLVAASLLAISFIPAPAAADPSAHRIYRIANSVADVAVDGSGNVYLASLAGTWRGVDAMVVKLNPSGDILWSRTFGGSAYDAAAAVAVDGSGNIYVTGVTQSTDFDGTTGAWLSSPRGDMDAFAAKLDASGNLRWASYLGGSDDEQAADVDWAPGGQLVALGSTWSCDFVTTSGAYDRTHGGCPGSDMDAFVVKLASDGRSAVFSTFLGGSTQEHPTGVAVSKSSGSVLVAGMTGSSNYPTTSGAYDRTYNGGGDVFVSKLSSDGATLTHSTYLGGSGTDQPNGFVRGIGGQPIVAGETTSTDLPVTSGAFQTRFGGGTMCSHMAGGPDPYWQEEVCPDAFVAQLRADFTGREFVTYVGTDHYDSARDVGIDNQGNVYVTGDTNSTAFPSVDAREDGGEARDMFALGLTPDGKAAMYSQRMGGRYNDAGDEIGVRSNGQVWIVGRSHSDDWAHSGSGDTVIVGLGPPTPGLVISPRSQSEWWVETYVGGDDANIVAKVEARDDDSDWVTLTKQPWGFYGGALHVEPGHTVIYRATTTDGRVYTYPDAINPFHADFQNPRGNEWWIQVKVVANEPLSGVDVRVNGGAWKPLTLRSWGEWAGSTHMPEGSVVQLRARSQDGDVHESPCYRWTSAAFTNCEDGGGGGEPSDFDATFRNVRGNEWWVETDVSTTGGTLAGVEVRVNGGTWSTLTKQSWGSWAKSIHAPAGSTVEFRARSTDGATDLSGTYRWPPS